MSKGLGRIQRTIVGLLDGSLKRKLFCGGGRLTTSELLAELQERGVIRDDVPRKVALFTVRRACHALVQPELLEGEYEIDVDFPWAETIRWRLKQRKEPR